MDMSDSAVSCDAWYRLLHPALNGCNVLSGAPSFEFFVFNFLCPSLFNDFRYSTVPSRPLPAAKFATGIPSSTMDAMSAGVAWRDLQSRGVDEDPTTDDRYAGWIHQIRARYQCSAVVRETPMEGDRPSLNSSIRFETCTCGAIADGSRLQKWVDCHVPGREWDLGPANRLPVADGAGPIPSPRPDLACFFRKNALLGTMLIHGIHIPRRLPTAYAPMERTTSLAYFSNFPKTRATIPPYKRPIPLVKPFTTFLNACLGFNCSTN